MRESANSLWISAMPIRARNSLLALAFAATITSYPVAADAQTSPPTAPEEDRTAHHPADAGQSKPLAPFPNGAAAQSGNAMGMMGGQPDGPMMGGQMGGH